MEKIIKDLREKSMALRKEIEMFNDLKLKREILSKIIEKLKSQSEYSEIKKELSFVESNLSIIYPYEDARRYGELISMILSALEKCESDKEIDEKYFETFNTQLKTLIKFLETEYSDVINTIHNLQTTKKRNLLDQIKKCLKWITNTHYQGDSLKEINKLLKDLKYDDEDILMFLEKYQAKVKQKVTKEPLDNKTIELLSYSFKKFEDIDIPYEKHNRVDYWFYSILAKLEDSFSLTDLTVELMNINDDIDIKKAVIRKLSKEIKRKYQENKVMLYDEEFYFSDEFKNEILDECRNCVELYEYLIFEYQNTNDNEVISLEDETSKKRLVLARSGEMTYLERDVRDLDKEILEGVEELLKDVNDNSPLVVFKKLQGFENLYEFKYNNSHNQLRLIVCNIVGNIYAVKGIIQKKQTGDQKMFMRVDQRSVDYNKFEEYINTYEDEMTKIYSYIESNKRKGIRK